MKLDFLTMSILRQIKRVNVLILHVRGRAEKREERKKKIRKSTNKRENDGNNYLYWVLST
jgi:hypothetical protein